MKLNHQQFGEQLELMGAHEIDLGKDEKSVRSAPSGATYGRSDYEGGSPAKRWSGPSAGQYTMGPMGEGAMAETKHGPETGHYVHADEHGNLNEEKFLPDWDPTGDIENVYHPDTRQMLMVGAQSRPTQMMKTDHPTHTLQPVFETETLYDTVHGAQKRQDLEASVALHGVSKPILMVKHQGRHVVIDGHHRLLAARKAGHPEVPVKVFDHDQHVDQGNRPIIGDTTDPFGRNAHSDDDLYSLHDDLHAYTHSGDSDDREPSGWT